MKPKIGEDMGMGWVLQCPACEGEHLHHESVEIFEREEDAERGTHVVVAGGKAVIDSDLSGNPSHRRHGLRIRFSCETCKDMSELTVVQHKGNTFLDTIVMQ